jgi:hypothetical protein
MANKHFEFADFVNEFAVTFTAYEQTEGQYNSSGKWIEAGETPKSMVGIILPLNNDDLKFVSNGVYTEKARKIYTTDPLQIGQRIEYKAQSFTIKQERPYSDYADVYIYYAEGVGK